MEEIRVSIFAYKWSLICVIGARVPSISAGIRIKERYWTPKLSIVSRDIGISYSISTSSLPLLNFSIERAFSSSLLPIPTCLFIYIYIIHKKIMFRNLCKQFQSIRSLTTLSAMDLFFATLAPPLTRVPEEFLLGSETANCLKSSDPVPIMRD